MIAMMTSNADTTATHNFIQWGPGVSRTVPNWTGEIGSAGVIHCHEGKTLRDALALALLCDPADAQLSYSTRPRAWVCEGSGRHVTDGLKAGYETLTTVRAIALPRVTTEDAVTIGLRLWSEWADEDDVHIRQWVAAWLDGEDRSYGSARDAEMRVITLRLAGDLRSPALITVGSLAHCAAVRDNGLADWWFWSRSCAASSARRANDAGADVAAIAGSVLLHNWLDK